MKSSVNQVEIARLSGLSRTAVAFALNPRLRDRLRPETTERVLSTARRLGYQPNRAARALCTGRFHTVGLLIADVMNLFYASFVRNFDQLLEAHGYDLVVEDTHLSLAREKFCLERMQARQVDGIFCFLANQSRAEFLPTQWKMRRPVVLIGTECNGLPADSTEMDFSGGMTQAADHLAELGHQKIAYMSESATNQTEGGRVTFLRKGLERHGLSLPDKCLIHTGHTMEEAYETFTEFLSGTQSTDWPTAVVAVNDLVAIGLMGAAQERGLRVPEDLSVIGVDNTPLARYLPVQLTSVAVPYAEIAGQAVEYFLERVRGKSWPAPRKRVFQTSLVVRRSTGRVKTSPEGNR